MSVQEPSFPRTVTTMIRHLMSRKLALKHSLTGCGRNVQKIKFKDSKAWDLFRSKLT